MTSQASENSIYDFIYLDLPKIRSYMAQMRGGVNVEYTKSSGTDINNNNLFSVTAKGEGGVEVPFLASGNGGIEGTGEWANGTNSSNSRSTTQNLEDILPRDMINALIDESLVHKSLAGNYLGKLVLIKGKILFLDYKQLCSVATPTLEFYLKFIASDEERKQQKQDKSMDRVKELMKVIEGYPIQLQAYLQTTSPIGSDNHVWMSLEQSNLNNNHFDTAFKYNICSEEDFYVLGVFDAQPDDQVDSQMAGKIDGFSKKLRSFNDVNDFLLSILSMYREIAGRPKDCYGVTPVAIFRQLEG